MARHQWIDSRAGVVQLAEQLKGARCIGVDTEFIRETTFFPKIALLQIATRDDSWLVDPSVLSAEDLAPFLDVLRDLKVLKIMHAAYADQECFYWAYDVVATPVLDTAVAGALCGYGDNVGLGKLLKECLDVNLPKGRARAKWLARPLPPELLKYAEQDVAYLVELAEILLTQLRKNDREAWAMNVSYVDPAVFEVSPEDMAWRISKNGQLDGATLNALTELIRWREDRARTANLPRGWVADNDILLALAKVKPTSVDELRAFRGLNGREVDRSGNAIIASIRRAKEKPVVETPPAQRPPPITEREDHLLEFIKTYVSFLADRHGIALRFLINTNRAMWLARHSASTEEEWVAEGILSAFAAKLIGDDLRALLHGKRALALRNGRVEILEL